MIEVPELQKRLEAAFPENSPERQLAVRVGVRSGQLAAMELAGLSMKDELEMQAAIAANLSAVSSRKVENAVMTWVGEVIGTALRRVLTGGA